MSRATGALIIGAYLVFLGSLLATAHSASPDPRLTVVPLVVVAVGRRRRAGTPAGTQTRPGAHAPAVITRRARRP